MCVRGKSVQVRVPKGGVTIETRLQALGTKCSLLMKCGKAVSHSLVSHSLVTKTFSYFHTIFFIFSCHICQWQLVALFFVSCISTPSVIPLCGVFKEIWWWWSGNCTWIPPSTTPFWGVLLTLPWAYPSILCTARHTSSAFVACIWTRQRSELSFHISWLLTSWSLQNFSSSVLGPVSSCHVKVFHWSALRSKIRDDIIEVVVLQDRMDERFSLRLIS